MESVLKMVMMLANKVASYSIIRLPEAESTPSQSSVDGVQISVTNKLGI